ncbi:hypothetical protein [Alicyclobacillus sp. SO9]|uniref:hypothetical protein n=1 Tax=Alicyclobacillus sp. SO9 TaxID=2665646 RepID=UPI0018E85BFB|nr:hypothetical protein [Alicyclobacillus sp. SO9]QQE77846.1 hypothetical protein GI364_18285 [Alicyclobacillus sp. SO9]
MGSTITSIEAKDNIRECRLFGTKQPSDGRKATEDEISSIRQWIHSVELVNELDGRREPNDPESKILIDLINGPQQPFFVQITRSAENRIQMIDATGAVKILKQPELRAFLDTL